MHDAAAYISKDKELAGGRLSINTPIPVSTSKSTWTKKFAACISGNTQHGE
jgi:hypothetical protein